jgi:hypothetical protein
MGTTNFPNGIAVGDVVIEDTGITGDVTGEHIPPKQVIDVAGPTAITLKNGVVWLARAGAIAAATLAAPTAGDDDNKILHIIATTAFAHTVTITGGLSGAGAGADVGTFGGAVGDRLSLVAYNGVWYPLINVNVTFA